MRRQQTDGAAAALALARGGRFGLGGEREWREIVGLDAAAAAAAAAAMAHLKIVNVVRRNGTQRAGERERASFRLPT